MANNSKNELLEWLELKPRTQGWGAVVAYDRNKCNNLLLQDYINKFTTNSFLPPINKPVPTGNANWEHLSDWITDVPRLSFEDSSKTAGGEVHMKMAVVGGTQVSIDNTPGHKRAIAVKSIDALDHPELIAENVALSKTSGTVGKDTGEVVLDLGNPETAKGMWELTFANTQHERRIGGAFFKQYYKEADEKKRLYNLGKIAYTDQQYLKPASFRLRTITTKGADVRSAANFGDGAVELFICMEGDQEGGTPPTDDWRNLITDEDDCTVLLSNKMVMQKCILPGARLPSLPEVDLSLVEVIGQAGMITGYELGPSNTSTFLIEFHEFEVGGQTVAPHRIDFNLRGAEPYKVELISVSRERSLIKVSWRNGLTFPALLRTLPPREGEELVVLDCSSDVDAFYSYEIDPESGVARFVPVEWLTKPAFSDKYFHLRARFPDPKDAALILNTLSEQSASYVESILDDISNSTKSLDLFVVNSILFNDNSGITMNSSSFPGDLVFFGRFNRPFTITTLEHLMGHSASHQFTVSGDFTGNVEWSVVAVPGSTGGIGTINKNSGLYTAPALADIPGTFTRVRVTATDPESKYSSSALVTVVVRDITVNPVVQICNATSEAPITRTLSANTLGEGVLEWKVKRGTGSIPPRAGSDGKNTYTAGPKDNDLEGSFTIDEIEVKNLATNKTQTAYVVVTHFSQDLIVTVDMSNSSLPVGKAKLKATDNRGKEVTAVWEVAEGNGSIDSSGLYTGDPTGQQRFALITAHTENADGSVDKDGWIILPWPLFELPDKPADNLLVD